MRATNIFYQNKKYDVMGTIIEATCKSAAVTKFILLNNSLLSESKIQRSTKLIN
jgi:hypothetical protein